MDTKSKKERERRILDMVYGRSSFFDLVENECPDFLIQLSENLPYFGIEVTEFYESETSARIDRIPNYSCDLLSGKDYKHKDDRFALDVAKIDIVKEDNSIHAKDVPAIVQHVLPLSECAKKIAQRIRTKTEQIRHSTAEISHANMIIQDKTGLLRIINIKDFVQIN